MSRSKFNWFTITSAWTLIGVSEILAITGDPSKVGHLPGATNVYDVNSKGLTELALRFNQGINTDGDALKKHTNFNIAGAFDPNVRKLDGQLNALRKSSRGYELLYYPTCI